MCAALLDDVRRDAARHGFNLVGSVAAESFDRSQPRGRRAAELWPACRSILVIGSGGGALWQAVWNGRPRRRPSPGFHPIDDHTASYVEGLLRTLRRRDVQACAVYPDDRPTLGFVPLGEMAGLGTVSPVIGQLLHPEYGPWVSLRAAVLVDEEIGTSADERLVGFQPCTHCSRPCVRACPRQVYDGRGGADLVRCGEHRHAGHCADGCDVRRACPVGAAHRYGREEESFRHAYSLYTMRRHLGLGLWKWVPRRLRGGVSVASR